MICVEEHTDGDGLGSIWKGRVTWVREGHDLCGGAYGWGWTGQD